MLDHRDYGLYITLNTYTGTYFAFKREDATKYWTGETCRIGAGKTPQEAAKEFHLHHKSMTDENAYSKYSRLTLDINGKKATVLDIGTVDHPSNFSVTIQFEGESIPITHHGTWNPEDNFIVDHILKNK